MAGGRGPLEARGRPGELVGWRGWGASHLKKKANPMPESDGGAGQQPQMMRESLGNSRKASDRNLGLFAVAVCYRLWHLTTDERSHNAVLVAERWADGRATLEEVEEARNSAWEVV